mmetsp:Transcript_111183/g.166564  ORF Transcript_111183/g.166564 Transcript_111183/m.166564 type:complete len:105 (+) Transcript_111183:364-678(+)
MGRGWGEGSIDFGGIHGKECLELSNHEVSRKWQSLLRYLVGRGKDCRIRDARTCIRYRVEKESLEFDAVGSGASHLQSSFVGFREIQIARNAASVGEASKNAVG